MESPPSSARTAGDGLTAQNDEVASAKEGQVESSSSSYSLANGSHDFHFMNNGKPRPSAVRDFPKNIVPINRISDAVLASAEKQQIPVPSKGTIEQKQIEDGLIDSADIALDMDSDKEEKDFTKKLHPDQKLTEGSILLSKKVQEERKKQASPGMGKRDKEKDVSAERTQKAPAMLGANNSAAIADKAQTEPTKVVGASEDKTKKTLAGKLVEKKSSANAATASVTKEMESKSKKEKIVSPERIKKAPSSLGNSVVKKNGANVSVEGETSKEKDIPTEKTSTKITKTLEKKASNIASAEREVGNTSQGEMEGMDIDKQEIDKELHISVKKSKEISQGGTIDENGKKVHPVKRKAGVRDLPEVVKHSKQKDAAKDVQDHSDQELGMKIGKGATYNAKIDSNGKKKRPPEGLDLSDRGAKLAKTMSSDVAQGKAKESSSIVRAPVVTPKAVKPVKKSSTASGSGKKVRQSAGKSSNPTSNTDLGDPRKSLLESLRLYDAVRRKYVQDEETNGKQKGSRADLQAATLLKKQNAGRGVEKAQGSLPGLLVGDIFLFRTELSFARVHGPIQAGIEYLTSKESEYNDPVAISIISNVGQDGDDNGEELLYTGQGGRSVDNKQIADQKLERGNLALDRSQKFDVPIRVIRGIKDVNSPTGKVYVYDGLYQVKESYTAKGSGGFDEFKFKLQRVPDQPGLGWDTLKLAADLKSQSPAARKDIVVADISKGKESRAICVENTVDDDKSPPAPFEYSTKVIYPEDVGKLQPSVGCKCKGVCSPSSSCSCFSKNGDDGPYLSGGYLVRQKDYVFECGSKCSCSSTCRNRATERSSRFQLDVFKTVDRGWGVRSLDIIPAGSFVCEYMGKFVADDKAETDVGNREHRLLTRRLPDTTPLWGDVPDILTGRSPPTVMPDVGNPQLMIDASTVGNVARFINHSCSPNLFIQKILSEHHDVRFPHFKLFALANIPPLTELTLDYGHPSAEELASELPCVDCLCGSSNCRGKLYL